MMQVSEILRRWPSRADVVADAREADELLQPIAVSRWASRGSIPPKYWYSLVRGAAKRDICLTADELMRAHSPQNGMSAE